MPQQSQDLMLCNSLALLVRTNFSVQMAFEQETVEWNLPFESK